ncbi:hypothetical protein AX16_003020 [Volvariella volvacea WC 439]|nr:hypothetical protein AX16_003020 [Volvariella volvacea WC 439]
MAADLIPDTPPYEEPPTTPLSSHPSESPASDSNVTFDHDSSSSFHSPHAGPASFIHISKRNASFKGSFVIDPCPQVPLGVLSPSPYGMSSKRPNVLLETWNGTIEADIHVVGPRAERGESIDEAGVKSREKMVMNVRTVNGSVVAKLVSVPSHQAEASSVPDDFLTRSVFILTTHLHIVCLINIVTSQHDASPTRHHIQISAKCINGDIIIVLPRSFNGLISGFRLNGSLKISTSIKRNAIPLGDFIGTKQWFVGDNMPLEWVSGDERDNADWDGDELHLITHNGDLQVYYEDEDELSFGPYETVHESGGFATSNNINRRTLNLGNFMVFGQIFDWFIR